MLLVFYSNEMPDELFDPIGEVSANFCGGKGYFMWEAGYDIDELGGQGGGYTPNHQVAEIDKFHPS